MRHVGIKTAFHNSDLDQDVYVSHPCNVPSEMKYISYYKLQKSLYVLLQAPLQWFKNLNGSLTGLQFHQLETDGAIFTITINVNDWNNTIVVLVSLDDLIFV